MNNLNYFIDTYKDGIPVKVQVDPMSVVVLCASVLVTVLLVLLAKKFLS